MFMHLLWRTLALSGCPMRCFFFFFFQAEDGIRDTSVTGVQTCALPIFARKLCLPPEKVGVRQHSGSSLVCQQELRYRHRVCANRASGHMLRKVSIPSAATQGLDDFRLLFARKSVHGYALPPIRERSPSMLANSRRARNSNTRILATFSPVRRAISLWSKPSTWASQSS